MPRASVIVCTFNRCQLLADCLASLVVQQIPTSEYEVLVVDNGSTDGTRRLVGEWAARVPNVMYVMEPVTGLARARNTGLRAAAGEVVAFLDDDAVASEGWLAAVLDAYERWPAVGAVAGPVELVWPKPRPGWLLPSFYTWFSRLDLGSEARLLGDSEIPFGTNMSLRRDAVPPGAFAPELGHRGRKLGYNDEVELFARLRGNGHAIAYEPAAVVRHRVLASRLSPAWMIRRAYAQGRSDAVLEALLAGRTPLGGKSPGSVAFRATIRGWRGAIRRMVGSENKPAQLMADVVRRAQLLGYAIGSSRLSAWPRGARSALAEPKDV